MEAEGERERFSVELRILKSTYPGSSSNTGPHNYIRKYNGYINF